MEEDARASKKVMVIASCEVYWVVLYKYGCVDDKVGGRMRELAELSLGIGHLEIRRRSLISLPISQFSSRLREQITCRNF